MLSLLQNDVTALLGKKVAHEFAGLMILAVPMYLWLVLPFEDAKGSFDYKFGPA